MAAQKAYTATFQPLHARVLKRRCLGARVRDRRNMSGVICEFAQIIWISHGRLAGDRIIDLQPRPDPVFFPNIIIVIEEIGWSMHAADYLDLIHRHSKPVVKTVQGVLYLGEGCSIFNSRDVEE